MAFCRNCGAELPEGANFCTNCGARVAVEVRTVKADYSSVGSVLILIGGILAMALSFLPLLMVPFLIFWRVGWRGMEGGGLSWPTGLLNVFAALLILGFVVAIVAGIVSIYAYTRVRAGEVKNGGLIALVMGVIMLLTMNWFPGIITVVGGALCYGSG